MVFLWLTFEFKWDIIWITIRSNRFIYSPEDIDMTINEMKIRKIELGYSNKKIAELSGLPLGTVQKVFSGATKAPRYETLTALQKLFLHPDTQKSYSQDGNGISPSPLNLKDSGKTCSNTVYPTQEESLSSSMEMVCDPGLAYDVPRFPVWRRQGTYTIDDYFALPDEQRVELIDGVFYDMAAPTTAHQIIGGFLHKLLLDYALAHGGPCLPLMSPVDVQLDKDKKTMVQPDVMILCDRSLLKKGRVFGAPDFLAEVLSPSTRKKDMQLKLYKYAMAGVREYWMIDPKARQIIVYDLEHELAPAVYGDTAKVPVSIWNGDCIIDFAQIFSYIQFLYDSDNV